MIIAIIAALVSAGLIFAGLVYVKKQVTSSGGAERESLIEKIPSELEKLQQVLTRAENYASKGQLEFLVKQLDSINEELNKEKGALQGIESQLETAQKAVEEKEQAHQEMKTAKEEDEMRLQELLEKHQQISSEAITLEQKLADSMKSLDTLTADLQLTPDQKGAFDDLSNGLTAASARLRDLLTEYNTLNERLVNLQQQHLDLEEEYTRLVEQQLGE